MEMISQTQLAEACGLLFGENFSFTPETLEYIAPSGIKQAFRSRVKFCHPDLNPDLLDGTPSPERDFVRLKEAYDFLLALKDGRKPVFVRGFHPAENDRGRSQETLPKRPLRIGEFLYLSGKISWSELINGLVWQKRTKPRLGELAVVRGYLEKDQVKKVLEFCVRRKRTGVREYRFGEAAVAMGILPPESMEKLLRSQKCLHPLGSYFIREEILSRNDLISLLTDLNRHNFLHSKHS